MDSGTAGTERRRAKERDTNRLKRKLTGAHTRKKRNENQESKAQTA